MSTKIFKYDIKFKNGKDNIIGYIPFKENHIAIIIPSDSENNYKVTVDNEISDLINYYRKKGLIVKEYFCFLADDFINIVKSEYVTGIHIFGHGNLNGLTFEDGSVLYREFMGMKPKDFVAQWHCNHGKNYNNSLGNIIGKKYYVKYGQRNYYSNRRDIKKLINGKLNWTINVSNTIGLNNS